MKLSKTLNTNVKSLVLLILIPILSILIIFMSWLSYDEMYKTIINGFNQKLIAISSTTGAFIDGDEHEKLAQAKEVLALSNGKNGELYGVDNLNYFLKIDTDGGAGIRLFKLDREINDIAYNPKNKMFYATSENEIISFSLKEKKTKTFFKGTSSFHGITYDSLNEYIYVSKLGNIIRIDNNKNITTLAETDYSLDAMSYDAEDKLIYAIERETDSLIYADTKDFRVRKLLLKGFRDVETPLTAIASHNTKLYTGSNHLIIYDKKEKSSTYEDFARGYRNEKDKFYKKYIAPMTKIKLEADLTYHYTQNLIYNQEDANCIYILDVSEGNEYTPIGSEDEMDKEAIIGAENVMLRKEVFVSKVQEWEQWGLLKVSFAPILNKDGEVKAIAGADVDMGIIREKTKEALMQSSIAGIVFLIISIIAAFSISKKIIEPIRKLKFSALRIAAGRHDEKVSIEKPQELSELSNTFNSMGNKLKDTVSHLTQYNNDVLSKRKEQDLQVKLDQRLKIQHNKIRSHHFKCSLNINGFLLQDELLYFWFSDELEKTSFSASKKREMISISLEAFTKHIDDPLNELKTVFNCLNSFGYVNLEKNTIHLHKKSKKLSVLTQNNSEDYIFKELNNGTTKIESNTIFSEYALLNELSTEHINFLHNRKYSHLHLKECSVVFAILKEGKKWN